MLIHQNRPWFAYEITITAQTVHRNVEKDEKPQLWLFAVKFILFREQM